MTKRNPERYPLSAGTAADREDIRRRLAECYAASGKSYRDIAIEIGLSTSRNMGTTVSDWLNEPDKVPADKLDPLCKALGVSRDWIISGHVYQPGITPIIEPTEAMHGVYTDDSLTTVYGKLEADEKKALSLLLGSLVYARRCQRDVTEIGKLVNLIDRGHVLITCMMDMIGKERAIEELGDKLDNWLRSSYDVIREYVDFPSELYDSYERELERRESEEALERVRTQTDAMLDDAQGSGRKRKREHLD